jgi:hypothetical protein
MLSALRRYVDDPIATWRTGSPQSQGLTLVVLLVGVALCFTISVLAYALMPMSAFYIWLLLGMLTLRFRPLVILSIAIVAAAFTALLLDPPMTAARFTSCLILIGSVSLVLYSSSRQQSGLPGPVSEAMLTDLRDRLQSQGKIPPLPEDWHSQSAMLAASGVGYGGDFLVANVDDEDTRLELILVDVCGKGVGAASRALQFGGALGGLIGALPPERLFDAANDFLLRQHSDETFATAVHVLVDLETGDYQLTSAGHPPALVWSRAGGKWVIDEARGTALGIVPDPELHVTYGRLSPGDALLFYTDGVVETRHTDLDEGVAWLQREASIAISSGFEGAAQRIIKKVSRGDDDRAVLILEHDATAVHFETFGDRLTAS